MKDARRNIIDPPEPGNAVSTPASPAVHRVLPVCWDEGAYVIEVDDIPIGGTMSQAEAKRMADQVRLWLHLGIFTFHPAKAPKG